MSASGTDELRAQLTKEAKKITKHNGFILAYYAGQALEDLKDLTLARQFIEAAEAKIGTEDQAHPCDLGKQIYKIFKDKDRAQLAYERSLDASGWDASSVDATKKDWQKIVKSFK
jgi:hypothetical protein